MGCYTGHEQHTSLVKCERILCYKWEHKSGTIGMSEKCSSRSIFWNRHETGRFRMLCTNRRRAWDHRRQPQSTPTNWKDLRPTLCHCRWWFTRPTPLSQSSLYHSSYLSSNPTSQFWNFRALGGRNEEDDWRQASIPQIASFGSKISSTPLLPTSFSAASTVNVFQKTFIASVPDSGLVSRKDVGEPLAKFVCVMFLENLKLGVRIQRVK